RTQTGSRFLLWMDPAAVAGRRVCSSTSALDIQQVYLTGSVLVVVSHNHYTLGGRYCEFRRIYRHGHSDRLIRIDGDRVSSTDGALKRVERSHFVERVSLIAQLIERLHGVGEAGAR